MPTPSRRPVRSKSKGKVLAAKARRGVRAEGGPGPGEKEGERSAAGENQAPGRTRGAGSKANNAKGKTARATRARSRAEMLDMEDTLKARELFWANVVREILCSLAEASQLASEERARREEERARQPAPLSPEALMAPSGGPDGQPGPDRSAGPPALGDRHPDVLDGRICVITTFGERIPIAEVKPLFAMGVDHSAETRALSIAVECSVFQIRTPKGMVFTLPIHEIRSVRAVSEELMTEIERERGEDDPERPFGFAAFTSMARDIGGGEVPVPWPDEQESHWE